MLKYDWIIIICGTYLHNKMLCRKYILEQIVPEDKTTFSYIELINLYKVYVFVYMTIIIIMTIRNHTLYMYMYDHPTEGHHTLVNFVEGNCRWQQCCTVYSTVYHC